LTIATLGFKVKPLYHPVLGGGNRCLQAHARRSGSGRWRSASCSRAHRPEVRSRSSSSTSPPEREIAGAHSHDGYDETIYELEGVLTWTIGGTPTEVGPDEAVFIPRGAVHHFDNRGDVDAKALAIATPGSIGPDFFREVGAILDATAGGPPDLAALGAVMRQHGLTPAA
jgi:mannose-6-phosphate isomerase-like protein (cupin superfamily)